MRLIVLLLISVLFLQQPVWGQTLQDAIRLYRQGELDQAKYLLLNLPEEQKEDPEVLFLLGKTEESGVASRNYLQDIVDQGCDWSDSDETRLLMCQYEFCRSMYVTTVDCCSKMEHGYPQSEKTPEILWISGSAFLAMENPDSAFKRFDRIIARFPRSSWAAWAQVARGDCFLVKEDLESAVSAYRQVLDSQNDSPAFPFALSGLIGCYSRMDDFEGALLYQNLLKERFPNSIEPIETLPDSGWQPQELRKEDRAERLTGVRYAIQLGVFGIKENAIRLKSKYEKMGYVIRIKTELIGGKEYSVVQLGSFASYQQALELKKELEEQTGDSYRIVIR